jgi:hypothetical protein
MRDYRMTPYSSSAGLIHGLVRGLMRLNAVAKGRAAWNTRVPTEIAHMFMSRVT